LGIVVLNGDTYQSRLEALMRLTTLKLVYKNMVWQRPMLGLVGLVALALFTTGNLYFNLKHFGNALALPFVGFSLLCWFVILPCALTLIDFHVNPRRMEKIWAIIANEVV
jgi:hypothetical protein